MTDVPSKQLSFDEILEQDSKPIPIAPILKWAGGKRWLLPELERIYDSHRHRRLVEPFVGGMAVALGLQPARALLNDLNPHLINLYQQIKNGLVISESMQNDRDFFFNARDQFNEIIKKKDFASSQAAQLFYYLNRTCFNGLCRFNNSGLFNVPFGKYKTINYLTDFSLYQKHFQSWSFCCSDFSKLEIRNDDFLYVDPPYDVEFTKYASVDFRWEDQE